MKNHWKKIESPLEKAIADCYETLEGLDPTEEDYQKVTKNVQLLEQLKVEIKTKGKPSPDAILAAVASVGGILIIVLFEVFGHAIPTKLLNLLLKVKH